MTTTIPAGFPTADNTGVPSGTTLTTYTGPMTITTDGTVIENKIINGALDVTGANVTIRNCIITYNDFFAIDVRGVNITVENCTIIGPGYNGDSPAAISCDVGGGTFIGNDISGAEHGIVLGPGSAVVVGNYIHDAGSNKADPHIGGISLKGEQNNVLIENNTVILGTDATSDIFLQNNWGSISNVTINHNYLGGDPGYNIYVEGRLSGGPVTGVSITNNVIVKGHYGDYSIVDASPSMSGNFVYPAGTNVTSDPTSPTQPGSTPPSAPKIVSFSADSGVANDHITNDNTLTLKGTGTAGSTITVLDGTKQVGTATADASGNWSITTAVLVEGAHSFTAKATTSGGTSGASTALAVSIDTVAPSTPTIVASTSAATLASTRVEVLTGKAEAGSTVAVFDGANKLATVTANASGDWTYTTAALSTGSHSFTASASDAAGNTGAPSSAVVVTISGQSGPPPAPTITSFSNDSGVANDHLTNDNTLTLKGTGAAGSTITVLDGTKQVGTATADASGNWSITTAVLVDGAHSFTAKATTSGGTSGASTALAVSIDTVAPSAPTLAASTSDSSTTAGLAKLAAGSATNVDIVDLTGTAEANSTIKVFDGATQIGTTTSNGNGVWTYTTDSLASGGHSFTAKAMDAAGNTGAASPAAVVSVTGPVVDPSAPTISSFSKDSGVAGDHITNDNTLTLTGTAAANSLVKVFDGSNQVGTATAGSSGAWSLTTTALTDGAHSLTATATTGATTGTTTPTVFEDFQPWNGLVSPDGIWRIAGTWQGTGGNTLQPGNVSFTNTYAGETNTGFMSLTVPAGSPLRGAELQSLTTPGYSYGYYDARILTTDVKNGGVVSFFWIEQPNYGSHEWDVEFTLSDSWAGTTNPGRVSFTTHPLDNTQWVDLAFNPSQEFHTYGFLWTPGRIDFTVDEKIVRTVTDPVLTTDATGYIMMNTWSGISNFGGGPPSQPATSVYDWVKFYAGATSIPVDGAAGTGGTTGSSAPLSVTVDTVAPSAPTVVASTSAATLASTRVEVLTGTAEANSTVTVLDGTSTLGTTTAGANGAWSYTTAALSTGNHSFSAKATDVAGNTGATSAAAVVNIPAPPQAPAAPTITSFSDDSGVLGDHITKDNTLTLTGKAAANSTVKVFDGSVEIGMTTADSSGSWDYITSVLKDATHVLTATATDSAGHASTQSAALDVTIDTHGPVAPTMGVYSQGGSAVGSTTILDDLVLKGAAEANSTIKVFDSGIQIGVATATGSGTWSFDTGHLGLGGHSFTSTAVDAAGNTGSASASAKVGITAPPENVPTADIEFTNISKNWLGGVTVSGTADSNSVVKLYDGTNALGSVTAGSDGQWTYTKWGLSNTVHRFTAQEIDSAGNVTAKSSGAAILGSSRSNNLSSTAGDDLLVGNGGSDTFVFNANFGKDVIKDFDATGRSHDVLEFSKSVFDSFASVLNHASQLGQDVVISAGSDTLTLKNTKLGALDSHDFHFT